MRWLLLSIPILLLSCESIQAERVLQTEVIFALKEPVGFAKLQYPSDNLPTASRISLGKKLFHEKRLSRDATVSCASCHLEGYAFADTASKSKGVND